MTVQTVLGGAAFLAGRVLFALVVGYLALGNLLDLEGAVGYAESKGAPLVSLTVPAGSLAMLVGAASLLFGVYPMVGGLAVAGFLVAVTPVMHDFWNAEGQIAENERIHFLKNAGLLGATLAFVALAAAEWPYALGVTL